MKFIAVIFFAASILTVQGGFSKDAVEKWAKERAECIEETKISEDKVKIIEEQRIVPVDDEIHEFLLCVYKKAGSITEDGDFNKELVEKHFSLILGDVEGPKVAEICSVTNQESEKAIVIHLTKCYFEHVTKEQEEA